jgi:hypothetical protein
MPHGTISQGSRRENETGPVVFCWSRGTTSPKTSVHPSAPREITVAGFMISVAKLPPCVTHLLILIAARLYRRAGYRTGEKTAGMSTLFSCRIGPTRCVAATHRGPAGRLTDAGALFKTRRLVCHASERRATLSGEVLLDIPIR